MAQGPKRGGGLFDELTKQVLQAARDRAVDAVMERLAGLDPALQATIKARLARIDPAVRAKVQQAREPPPDRDAEIDAILRNLNSRHARAFAELSK